MVCQQDVSQEEMSRESSEPDRAQVAKEAESKDRPQLRSSASSKLERTQPRPRPRKRKIARVSTPMRLDGERFEYPYYLNVLKSKLTETWLYPSAAIAGKKVLRARVSFCIYRDGSVGGVKVEQSSRNPVFDRSVLRAVEAAAPFPPLPDGYKEERLGELFVTFEYYK